MRYFLGVDIGGTKSHALIADENGQVVGFGRAGAGNWEAVGYDGLQQVLASITSQAAMTDHGRRALNPPTRYKNRATEDGLPSKKGTPRGRIGAEGGPARNAGSP